MARKNPKSVVVIPARYSSSRFPGKPLALIRGRPLIWWVWNAARKSKRAEQVIVATDDHRIIGVVNDFGGEAVPTEKAHLSGTERVAEVASRLDAEIVVNLQGDEPLVSPLWIDSIIDLLQREGVPMATLAVTSTDEREWHSPDVVKVVLKRSGFALYFSRAPVPYPHPSRREMLPFLKHVGVYGFKRETLFRFVSIKRSHLEEREGLEQLRAVESDIPIKVLVMKGITHSVDRPEDIGVVEEILTRSPLEFQP